MFNFNKFSYSSFIIITLSILVLTSPVSADIVTSQTNEVLNIQSSIDLNVTIEFYDGHQVFLSSIENFTAFPAVNVTINSLIAGTGGFFRVAHVNESISTKAFVDIIPWGVAQGNNNNNQAVTNSTIAQDLPVVGISNDSDGIAGEIFLVSAGTAGLMAFKKKGIKK